jgi:CRISPR-associated protein Cas1
LPVLYVTDQAAEVGLAGNRLIVHKGPTRLGEMRLDDCAQVVVMGHVQVSTQALRAALARGIEFLFLTRGGRFLGRLSNGLAGHVELRMAQFRRFGDPAIALNLARGYVRGKIENQRRLLLRYQRDRQDDRIATALVRLRRAQESLPGAGNPDMLRGIEGAASREYFAGLGRLFKAPGIVFRERLRRPPPDPVNILLSFGYTLLAGALHGMAEQVGLDPYLGVLHAPERGRPSLVLDLMEEFRPVLVDAAVLRVFNTRTITLKDFVWPTDDQGAELEDAWERQELDATDACDAGTDGADAADRQPPRRVLLTNLGVRKWILAFERRMEDGLEYPRLGCRLSYRQILLEQVRLLARHLLDEGEYASFQAFP